MANSDDTVLKYRKGEAPTRKHDPDNLHTFFDERQRKENARAYHRRALDGVTHRVPESEVPGFEFDARIPDVATGNTIYERNMDLVWKTSRDHGRFKVETIGYRD